MTRGTIILKPTLAERRKAAVSAVMQSQPIKDFLGDIRVADRANTRNFIREFVEAGYDTAILEIEEVLTSLRRERRLFQLLKRRLVGKLWQRLRNGWIKTPPCREAEWHDSCTITCGAV